MSTTNAAKPTHHGKLNIVKVKKLLKRDIVLTVTAIAALISCVFVPPSAAYLGYIDWQVIGLLFCLLAVSSGLARLGCFDWLAEAMLAKVSTSRQVLFLLLALCFVSSMFVTNDVALVIFVPLAIMVLKSAGQGKLIVPTVVLQTIAANLGSMLLPLGNPQNLYLYTLSGFGLGEFVLLLLPFTLLAAVMLVCLAWALKSRPLVVKHHHVATPEIKRTVLYLVLFVAAVLAVARVLPWQWVTVIVLLLLLVGDRQALRQTDFGLLVTFICFFVLVGNLRQLPIIEELCSGLVQGHELLAGVLSSQVISNVPAAVLLSAFSESYELLILGVDIGGLGTPVASLASLISYKYYLRLCGERPGHYLIVFLGLNILFLVAELILAGFLY